jgi:hypothetical protein
MIYPWPASVFPGRTGYREGWPWRRALAMLAPDDAVEKINQAGYR